METPDDKLVVETPEEVQLQPEVVIPTRPPRIRFFWVSEHQLTLIRTEAKDHAERLAVMFSGFGVGLSTTIAILTTHDTLVERRPDILLSLWAVVLVSFVVAGAAAAFWFRKRRVLGDTLAQIQEQHRS